MNYFKECISNNVGALLILVLYMYILTVYAIATRATQT